MSSVETVDLLSREAIALLERNGLRILAGRLRTWADEVRRAPTAGARRRRMAGARVLAADAVAAFVETDSGEDGLRIRRTARLERDERRCREILDRLGNAPCPGGLSKMP